MNLVENFTYFGSNHPLLNNLEQIVVEFIDNKKINDQEIEDLSNIFQNINPSFENDQDDEMKL